MWWMIGFVRRWEVKSLRCLDEQALVFDLLKPEPVSELLKAHRSGRQDNHKILFSLVMLEYWLRGLGSGIREKDALSRILTTTATL
jgi:hypothetical protein